MVKLVFRLHALQRMFSRQISEGEVRFVVEHGDPIEKYDHDTPYPSQLILGVFRNRILHVVAAINSKENEVVVITVYEPDPHLWSADFKSRRYK